MSSSTTAAMRLALSRRNHRCFNSQNTRFGAVVSQKEPTNEDALWCQFINRRTKTTKATTTFATANNPLSPSPQPPAGGVNNKKLGTANRTVTATAHTVIKATNMAVSVSATDERKFFSMAVPLSSHDHDSIDEPDYMNHNQYSSSAKQSSPSDNNQGSMSSSSSSTTTTTDSSDSDSEDDSHAKEMDWDEFQKLQDLASHKSTPLRLAEMYKYGAPGTDSIQRIRNAQFLYRELPIRIAQRAVDLLTLPHGLCHAKPIQDIAHIYLQYLKQFQNFPCPQTFKEEEEFTTMLQGMVLDKKAIPDAIAKGVQAWREEQQQIIKTPTNANASENDDDAKDSSSSSNQDLFEHDDGTNYMKLQEMEDALYRFFTARVGLRLLTEHHVLSSSNWNNQQSLRNQLLSSTTPHIVGVIQNNCDPVSCVSKVAQEVQRQTKERFGGISPEIEIVSGKMKKDGDMKEEDSEEETGFTYIPHHLQYMLTELLKNSCRATVQRYLQQNPHMDSSSFSTISKVSKPDPVRVVIVKGKEDVTIKVADRGGGVPRSVMKRIFTFAHSTSNHQEESKTEFGQNSFTGSHQSVNGFGLPMTRIYARYFGGELTLKSMEGYGLDAYLYLPRLGNACENLPQRVLSSPGEGDSTPIGGKSSLPPQHLQQKQQQQQQQQRGYVTSNNNNVNDDVNNVGRILKNLQTKALKKSTLTTTYARK